MSGEDLASIQDDNARFALAVTEAQFEYAISGHRTHVSSDEAEEMILDLVKDNLESLTGDQWLEIGVIALSQVARKRAATKRERHHDA